MNQTCFIYCAIAVVGYLAGVADAPNGKWAWFKFILGALAAFFVTWKAYLSQPKP
mgnify:CR=1 FL=1